MTGISTRSVRLWLEILAVMLLAELGLVLGALSGFPALGPVLGMLLPIAAATLFLHREGSGWRELGFPRPMGLGLFVGWTAAALVGAYFVTNYVVTPLMRSIGTAPLSVDPLAQLIEGNLTAYLLFLLPVSWGSAAFGEELIARGFLQNRFRRLYGVRAAVVLQAAIFALAHAYQGLMGIANIFALALVFGAVYELCGRNLWPLIAAHGIVDTIGITFLYLGRTELLTGS